MKLLSSEEIKKKLLRVSGWVSNEKLTVIEKKFQFENFTDAVCFLNRVAEMAELEDHHPDFHLTNYKNLRIVLSTHSVGGLTQKDFVLASKIEEVGE